MEEMITTHEANTADDEQKSETLQKSGKRQRLECESEKAIGQQQLGTNNSSNHIYYRLYG